MVQGKTVGDGLTTVMCGGWESRTPPAFSAPEVKLTALGGAAVEEVEAGGFCRLVATVAGASTAANSTANLANLFIPMAQIYHKTC
jgi:hypothetical protein